MRRSRGDRRAVVLFTLAAAVAVLVAYLIVGNGGGRRATRATTGTGVNLSGVPSAGTVPPRLDPGSGIGPPPVAPPTSAVQPPGISISIPALRPSGSPTADASRPARSSPAAVVVPPTTVPSGPPGPWRLVLDEEFSGSRLDASRWNANWLGEPGAVTPPVNSFELANYSPANVSVTGGHLVLTATPTPSTVGGTTRPDTSGLVNTYGHFQYTYGYAEARIEVGATPDGVFNWPAFWADGVGRWPTTGEDDIFEPVEGTPRWHFTSTGGTSGGPLKSKPTGWHTYGADWEPGSVTYYVDGKKVARTTRAITGAPMYLILNLAIGGRYSGPVVVPSTMEVDYVKVWQH